MSLWINTEDVVHETLDGEVVIVNLKNGRYYSLVDSGALLWAGLRHGLDEDRLGCLLTGHYQIESATAREVVAGFLHQLISAGLLEESTDALEETEISLEAASRLPFQPPELTEHEDMEGLLLLDPVHEVATEGWPVGKQ